MPYNVTTADVEARWRPLSDAERTIAITLIEDATVQIDSVRPRLASLVAEGAVPERLVRSAICESIQRVLRNPDLLRAQNLTGDGGVGLTYGLGEDTNHSLPRLRVTDEDLFAIDAAIAALPTAPPRVRSVRLFVA